MQTKKLQISKILIALCLCICLLPPVTPNVYAANTITVGTYAELSTAVSNASTGDTISLTADINSDTGMRIEDKTITFDLNGYNLTIIATLAHGLYVKNGGVELIDDGGKFAVTGPGWGVKAENGGIATVTSATSTSDTGFPVSAGTGCRVTVLGDVGGKRGLSAIGEGCFVQVDGNVNAAGTGAISGVSATDGATVEIGGTVTSSGTSYGVYAQDNNTFVSVVEDVIVSGDTSTGAGALNGARVSVGQDVQGKSFGVYASSDAYCSIVYVGGNVTATEDSTGIGIDARNTSQVTVDGNIWAAKYLKVNEQEKDETPGSRTNPTTKLGYATYHNGGGTVWVKAPGAGVSANPLKFSSAGGSSEITVTGPDLPEGITATAFLDGADTGITGTTSGGTDEQKVTLNFPENTSTTADKIYTVKLSLDGGASWSSLTMTVTVESQWAGAVCSIGNTPYYTLDDAFNSALDSDTIVLLSDINLDSTLTVIGPGTNYLNLNGHSLIIDVNAGYGLIVQERNIILQGDGSFDVTGFTYGVYAIDGGSATVTNANADSPDGIGVYAHKPAGSDLDGSVTVLNDIVSNGYGATAEGEGKITVNGNVSGDDFGVFALDTGSTVIVEGNVTAVGNGAQALSGAEIIIGGNVLGKFATYASGSGSSIEVGGDVTSNADSVDCSAVGVESGGSIEIGGNVSSVQNGIIANGDNSAVFVRVAGDVTVTDADSGVGVSAYNANLEGERAEVIIDGTISAANYINVGTITKTQENTLKPTTKLGYVTYKEGNNTVWVKAPGAGVSVNPSSLPSTGGLSEVIVTGPDLPDGITAAAFLYGVNTGITGTTSGGSDEQKVTLSFPENTNTTAEKIYTIKLSLDGGISWSSMTATVTAAKQALPPGGGGGGGGGGGDSEPAYNAVFMLGNTQSNLPVTVNEDTNNASINITSLAAAIFSSNEEVLLTMPSIPGVNSYTLITPASSIDDSEASGRLNFVTEQGSITIPDNMLTGTGLSGEAGITIGEGEISSLPEDVQESIGDRPVIQLTLSINGRQTEWNNPGAPVTVSIPYTPTAEELRNPESIVVWYIDGSGRAVSVPNGRYDPETGTVIFTTTHFSLYAITYNMITFKDVYPTAWYRDAVVFIAARGITAGTGDGSFESENNLTRAEFLVMMMKAYEMEPGTDLSGNFADAGTTWYTGYLAAAKKLGIAAGIGNNLFAPDREINRQEMFTLLYNTLKLIDKLPEGTSGSELPDYRDAVMVAPWAKDAMTLFVKTGIVSGSGGLLSPEDTTTRAEMAQVLYSLLTK